MRPIQLTLIRVVVYFSFLNLLCFFSCSTNDSPTESNGQPEQQDYAPKAEFSATPQNGEAPLVVSFDASASSDQDGEIVSYSWNYGDGSAQNQGRTTPIQCRHL